MKLPHSLVAVGFLLLPIAPAAAQGGGFVANDLYVYAQLGIPPFAGIVRVPPLTGASSLHVGLGPLAPDGGVIEFDAYRQRLVYLEQGTTEFRVKTVDGNGNVAPLIAGEHAWTGLASAGDGRIYHYDKASPTPGRIRWLDAANQVHQLFDVDGVTPYAPSALTNGPQDMIYHAGENALFIVHDFTLSFCSGGSPSRVFVHKIPLSADGTRVAGTLQCNEFDLDPTDGEGCAGLSLLPNGDLLLGAHNAHYGSPLARLLRVNPVTLAITPYASFGDAANGGSVYSHALGKAVAHDVFKKKLLAYSDGQIDNGAAVPSSIEFADPRAVIVEIPALACDGAWIAYGAGLAGKGGIVPRIYGSGCPAPGAPITLKIDQVVGGAAGLLFIGATPTSLPFVGGTLLVNPIGGGFIVVVGGAAGTAGAGAIVAPAMMPNDASLSGLSVFLQAGFADAAATAGASLTQGLEIEIG